VSYFRLCRVPKEETFGIAVQQLVLYRLGAFPVDQSTIRVNRQSTEVKAVTLVSDSQDLATFRRRAHHSKTLHASKSVLSQNCWRRRDGQSSDSCTVYCTRSLSIC